RSLAHSHRGGALRHRPRRALRTAHRHPRRRHRAHHLLHDRQGDPAPVVTRSRAALLAAVTLLVLVAARRDTWPLLRGPAPYPPEWQWGYAPKPAPPGRLARAVGLGGALIVLAALAGRT